MESDKLNCENPSASSFVVQENDEFYFTNRYSDASGSTGVFHNGGSGRVDPLPSPSPAFPWKLVHGTYPPYTHSVPDIRGNLMIDLNKLHNPQTPPLDPNSVNMRTGIPNPCGQNLPFPEENSQQLSYTNVKSGVSDTSMIDSTFSNCFKISEINRNTSLIRGNTERGYEMTGQGVDADGSYVHGPPPMNIVGLGDSETINSQNSGVLYIDDCDHASRFGCPKNTDGSFHSLGIGDRTDARFKSDLSRGEIPGELEGAVFPQLNASHVQQATGSSLNPRQNLFSAFPSFQNNVVTGLGNEAGGWASTNNNGGEIRGTNTGVILRPFHVSQKPQADIQHGFPISSNSNLGFVDDRDLRYVNSDPYKAFVGGVTTPSGPISSSSARLFHSGQVGASRFATEPVNFMGATTQPISDQLRRFMETFSPVSSMVSSFGGVKGSSIRQEHSGQLFPPTGCNSPVAARGGFFPKRAGFQVNKASAAQAAGSGLFPKRLGIQVNENSANQAAGDGLFPKGFQEHMPLQTKDLLGSTSRPGPVISTAKGNGLSQASNALGGPHRRGTVRPPPASPQVQRKKIALQPPILPTLPSPAQCNEIALQPPILPSSPFPPETAPAAALPIPAPARVRHVKWHDSEERPLPSGHRCLLCKRDLSFTAGGQVYQPAIPPAVAVLPCGHTFHDHCLQLITPGNQSKHPPCIPCAIGET